MQPDSLSPQEEVKGPEPSLVQVTKPQPKRDLTAIVLSVFLVILLIAVAGVGFWAYKLNTNLAETKSQLATLQSDYAKLKSDNGQLTTDLAQANADLKKSNGDLAAAQTSLSNSQSQNQGLQAKIDATSKKMDILYAYSTGKTASDVLAIDTLIKATNDKQLLTQWNSFVSSPSVENSAKLLIYLIGSIRDGLK